MNHTNLSSSSNLSDLSSDTTMNKIKKCDYELSGLALQLQNHRKLLTNDPYIEHIQSSHTKPLNVFYFPYYSMVEQYIHFADEYSTKLNQFKELLLQSLQNNTASNSDNIKNMEMEMEMEDIEDMDNTSDIEDDIDTYLPIIDEDKETVYSYNSYNLSTTNTNISYYTFDNMEQDINNTNHDDTNNDLSYDDSQYVYSDESDDESDEGNSNSNSNSNSISILQLWHKKVKKQFIFSKPIYCSTLVYMSMHGGKKQMSYDDIISLFINIANINIVTEIVFKRNFKGFYYALIKMKESKPFVDKIIHDIAEYSNNNGHDIVINIFKPSTHYFDREYYLNMKQNNKLCVSHFDILNGNIYYDLVQLFGDFGEIQSIELFTNDTNQTSNNNTSGTNEYNECVESDSYVLIEFKCIRDAVKCFDAHNINMTITGYCNSLYLGDRLLTIKYAD